MRKFRRFELSFFMVKDPVWKFEHIQAMGCGGKEMFISFGPVLLEITLWGTVEDKVYLDGKEVVANGHWQIDNVKGIKPFFCDFCEGETSFSTYFYGVEESDIFNCREVTVNMNGKIHRKKVLSVSVADRPKNWPIEHHPGYVFKFI